MLAAAIAVAIALWGPPPCVAAYHVADLEGDVLGQVVHHDPTYCEVLIDRRPWRWWQLCAVVVHEAGHTHGLPHSADPLNVMYPELWRPADVCRGKRPAQYPRGAVIRFP